MLAKEEGQTYQVKIDNHVTVRLLRHVLAQCGET